ncbi:hypothetical protein BS50DRAFT_583044 [Corynespora cassiicola Philippines]|uniref:Uncharacterized protein n=1 Tax=Corynespora cassiicola Philippines TaxID=1448308 RepID=A0A2T2P781_CORCC|nr:hypothetical protein BS50DRAFT_583044 [Corynespora cassiicola Philippines]
MDQQSHFLRLPREIRDLVYKNYVYEKDGYVFDSQTGKFATKSNRNRIDLSLMYTCLQVGNEMKGVALGHNVVVFSTFHSKEYRAFAGIWDYQTRNAYFEKILFVERYAPVLPEAKFDILEHEHPQLLPILKHLRHRKLGEEWGVLVPAAVQIGLRWGTAPSVYLDLLDRYLELGDFAGSAFDETWRNRMSTICPEALARRPFPWLFPKKNELKGNYEHFKKIGWMKNSEIYCQDYKYRFSAAAMAIHCLTEVSYHVRMQIKRIELYEDHPSVANPECHTRGLIKFCQENPKLKVNRNVDLWRNALLSKSFRLNDVLHPSWSMVLSGRRGIPTAWISKILGYWIIETMNLPSLGMPDGSFSLIFDGEPAPKEASDIFKILQRDSLWQAAYDNAYELRLIPDRRMLWFHIRAQRCHIFDGFPQAMESIVHNKGKSMVRCNFDVGLPQENTEKIINDNRALSDEEWNNSWGELRERQFYHAPSCLPTWISMWYENSFWVWQDYLFLGALCYSGILLCGYFRKSRCT